MSESVGKISLDLELQADLSRQIQESATNLGKQLQKAVSNSNMDAILSKIINNFAKNMNTSIRASMNTLSKQIDATLKKMTQVKVPVFRENNAVKAPSAPRARVSSPRAPPKVSGLNVEYIRDQMESVASMMENIEAKISLQNSKLRELKQRYNDTFDGAKKSTLEGKILNVEGAIIRLIAQMDKLNLKYADLETKERQLDGATSKLASTFGGIPIKLTKINTAPIVKKISGIGESAEQASDKVSRSFRGMKIHIPQVNTAPAVKSISDVNTVLENAKYKAFTSSNQIASSFKMIGKDIAANNIKEVVGKTTSSISNLTRRIPNLFSGLRRIGVGLSNLFPKFSLFRSHTQRSRVSLNGFSEAVGGGIGMLIRYGLIAMIAARGISLFANYLFSSLQTNAQFSRSLNQVKTNLLVAFLPIYNAILPAINTLMNALSRATAYIASFISALFGKTYRASYQAAQGLVSARAQLGLYANAASDAGQRAKAAADKQAAAEKKRAEAAEKAAKKQKEAAEKLAKKQEEAAEKAEKKKKAAEEKAAKAAEKANEKAKKENEELKRSLAGFDEIEKLDEQDDDSADDLDDLGDTDLGDINDDLNDLNDGLDDLGDTDLDDLLDDLDDLYVPELIYPDMNMESVDAETVPWAEKFKNILSKLFQPFKEAWNKEGANTVAAMKYALEGILGLTKAIGKSFLDVWTNGTGTTFLIRILQLLQVIFYIIGDIANAFRIAWETNSLGTRIIQAIFDLLISILDLLIDIGESFRNAWGNGTGVEICTLILNIILNILNSAKNLVEAFRDAWNENQIGTQIIQVVLDIIIVILSTIDKIAEATEKWSKNIDFSPLLNSIFNLLQSIEPLTQNVGDGLKWFYENVLLPLAGWTVTDLIPAFLVFLAETLELVNAAVAVALPLFSWLWKEFLEPIAQWTGGLVIDVLEGLTKKLSGISKWISENEELVKGIIAAIGLLAVSFGIVSVAIGIYNGICSIMTVIHIAAATSGGILAATVGALNLPFLIAVAAIAAIIAIGVLLCKNWDTIKAKCTEVWDWVKKRFEEFDSFLTNVFTTDWTKSFGVFGEILNAFFKNVSNIWESIKKIFNGIIEFISGMFASDWERAWNGIKDIFGGIFDSLAALAKAPLNAVIAIINGAIGGINAISIDIPDWSPIFPGKHIGFSIPKIQYLARGGIVDAPTLSMVGEAGKEAVMPLENNTGWIDDLAGKISVKIGNKDTKEIIGLLEEILILLRELDLVALDEESLRKWFIKKTNQNTKAKGVCELIT